ncbi:uncharacterized protein F5Z01DRAFT_632025 [Emericellopsis atlantica]|uniref:Uncharacterized protein n=1 Tax=Emericellopsis atlantica TaxID=2614577 RepID=A0A9P7ZWZ0_9HYPO|nr:uncharacterized protein F5Z01DRAFT_632025 [Emericellopsis atlantica]KAG9258933.1 hypothetical protein F5Z01DRAFT_632025 [Emericellopsis atlantica]
MSRPNNTAAPPAEGGVWWRDINLNEDAVAPGDIELANLAEAGRLPAVPAPVAVQRHGDFDESDEPESRQMRFLRTNYAVLREFRHSRKFWPVFGLVGFLALGLIIVGAVSMSLD